MKKIISRILQLECFTNEPPVLVDIGASGSLPIEWKYLAPFAIGIAFDADMRDFKITQSTNNGWKKLYSFNRLVTPTSAENADFYLTRSPHCSSSLLPDNDALKPWAFSKLFNVEEKTQLPSIDLNTALREIEINYIDWYKSDTQGTDLRIFKSLPSETINKIIISEFEPGIIDAYLGEDKLHSLMEFMDTQPFWVSDMKVKGSQRIREEDLVYLNSLQRRSPSHFVKTSPGWCEISYMNNCNEDNLTLRTCLLSWIFATIKEQHTFAINLAREGEKLFGSEIFTELLTFSRRQLIKGYPKLLLNTIKRLMPKR